MARFLLFLAISLIAALGFILILPLTDLARASGEIAWTNSLYVEKSQIANAIRRPRVLVVGGSSTLFSFDAERAERRLGRPVVNYGTHAGLGLDYILDRAARILRSGDTVILVPEYELLAQPDDINEYAVQLVAFYDRDYPASQPWYRRPSYYLGYDVLPALLSGGRALFGHPAAGRDDIVLDRCGDARGNTVARSTAQSLRNSVPGLSAWAPQRLAHLRGFAELARARGAKVLVIPPALISTPGYRAANFRKRQQTLAPLYVNMGMTPVADPASAFLAPQDMYDSVYHANDRGRVLYTGRMLDALCRVMTCP
jgi:hypothetical protein